MRYAIISETGTGKVWIIADDALARGPGSRFLVSGWPGFQQIGQNIPYLNGTYQANLAWGNRLTTMTLDAEYEFRDEATCFVFGNRLSLDVPLTGVLELGTRGTLVSKMSYPNAIIRSVVPLSGANDPTVVSLRLRYSIEAGAPQQSGAKQA